MTGQNSRLHPRSKRETAVKRVLAGEAVSVVARDSGIARKTLYAWLRRYSECSGRARSEALSDKFKTNIHHPRFYGESVRYQLLSLVVKDPTLSITKYAQKLNVGRHAVYTLLRKYDIATKDGRIAFRNLYNGPGRLETDIKTSIVNAVERGDITVTEAAREHAVSRKTIYRWINRQKYQESLESQYCRGEAHYKRLPSEAVQKILATVRVHPTLSIHALARILPYSSHGIFNVLSANNLTYKEARIAFAARARSVPTVSSQVGAETRVTADGFVPNLAPAPPPTFFDLIKYFATSSVLSLAIFVGGRYMLDLIINAPTPSFAIGIIFAAISFTMGGIFFLYSLKYYLTLAIVLSYSQSDEDEGGPVQSGTLLQRILGRSNISGANASVLPDGKVAGLESNLDHISLSSHPYISVQIPFYNEKYVAERSIIAATNFDYKGDYEVIVCDDSTDETTEIIQRYLKKHATSIKIVENKEEGWSLSSGEVRPGVTLKHLHRTTRSGFKGAALKLALTLVDDRTEFISIFDADFVPYPDSLELFLKYFKLENAGSEDYSASNIAAVQGYQWHVLNKSENWITRGVRSEYSGSYVIERAGQEIYGGLKHISGSVYMIRRAPLEAVGWKSSITEDYELTLRLYKAGYKVVYTPYIQAPAECVSTMKRLIRQRMRWAEGHSYNVKLMWKQLLVGKWEERNPKIEYQNSKQYSNTEILNKEDGWLGHFGLINSKLFRNSELEIRNSDKVFIPSPLTFAEKIEFGFNIPYYLQAFFFLVGTFSWLISEAIFPARFPFWTSLWGWSLVLTNMFALPLVNAIGLFLEESEERDYVGLASFVVLSYIVAPFQAYAAMKGFLEKEEGGWFRTPKTGRITDVFTRGTIYRFIEGILPGKSSIAQSVRIKSKLQASDYLALATANNSFKNFSLKPISKKRLMFGRIVIASFVLVFIGVNYQSTFAEIKDVVVRPPTTHAIQSTKTDFALTEKPEFLVIMPQSQKKQSGLVKEIHASEQVELETKVYYGGQEVDVPITKEKTYDGNYKVTLNPGNSLKPGKYSLVTSVAGLSETSLQSQDFTWGVLAVNFNKATYQIGDYVEMGIGVVDDKGNTVCDAEIEVHIKSNQYSNTFSTSDSIRYSDSCGATTVTNEPDYSLSVPSLGIGNYEVSVEATIENGERAVYDYFEIHDSLNFDIERDSATRIFPPADYTMNIRVTPEVDFEGTITERVPRSFEITGGPSITEEDQVKLLTWDVTWEKGETYNLSYTYDAPDIAPEFYILGPLEFYESAAVVYREGRSWQIAADAVTHDATTDGGENTSFSHTTSGTDRVLLVFVNMYQTTDPDVSSITYNGTPLSKVTEVTNNWVSNRYAETQVWSVANPSTGSNTVSVSLTGTPAAYSVVATSYSGLDTADPVDAVNSNIGNSSNPSVTITTENANSLIVGGGLVIGGDTDPFTPGSGTTERWDNATGTLSADIGYFGGEESTTTAGNYTFDFTSSASDRWTIAAVEVVVPEKLLYFILIVPFVPYYLKRKRK